MEQFIFLIIIDYRGHNHRYVKKSRLLKFCCVPATSVTSFKGIFVAATDSTNQAKKAGSMCQ